MDDILNAPVWQKALAVALAFLVAVWGYYSFLCAPKIREINSLRSTLKSVQTEIELIAPQETVVKGGVSVKELIGREIEDLMRKIPTEREIPFIIDELISGVGKGLNIDYRFIQPQKIVTEDKYKRLPLKVSFTADYTDINLYLKQLKNLPATVRIDTFSLEKTPTAPKLSTNMALSIFIMPVAEMTPKEEKPLPRKPYLFDPFFKLIESLEGEKEKKRPSLELQGIWKGRSIRAIINNKVVSVGDSVNGNEVIEIRPDGVTLFKDNKKINLKLEGGR